MSVYLKTRRDNALFAAAAHWLFSRPKVQYVPGLCMRRSHRPGADQHGERHIKGAGKPASAALCADVKFNVTDTPVID